MASQILFFQKSKCDLSLGGVSATASQGSTYANRALNRSNLNAWITSGSVDADNTTWTVDMAENRVITDILLIKHNFKSFKVEYWDGAAWQAFTSPIDETTNTATSNYYAVSSVSTSKLRITVRGTMTANQDKYLYQFIATERIGRLESWPVIKNPTWDRNRSVVKMLSGKEYVLENVGGFKCELEVKVLTSSADAVIFETIFDAADGVLFWPCGGNESQFRSARKGYRLEDIFLVKATSNYQPEWHRGIYTSGIEFSVKLSEVTQ
jgi:hypothetical protein